MKISNNNKIQILIYNRIKPNQLNSKILLVELVVHLLTLIVMPILINKILYNTYNNHLNNKCLSMIMNQLCIKLK